jgi:mannose-1-phosphate guanylyltransferase / mannose-6-phosphate isomerase
MVAPRNRTQELKQLVARLVRESRDEVDALPTIHRLWGSFTALHKGHRVQVKHIVEAVRSLEDLGTSSKKP